MTGVRLLGMTGVRFIDTLKPAALKSVDIRKQARIQ